MLHYGITVREVKPAVTALAPRWVKVPFQPIGPGITPGAPHELSAVHREILASVRRTFKNGSYSSRVVMSPGSSPSSCAFSSRRIILPERVLGRVGVNSISDGTAMGPNSRRTCC